MDIKKIKYAILGKRKRCEYIQECNALNPWLKIRKIYYFTLPSKTK